MEEEIPFESLMRSSSRKAHQETKEELHDFPEKSVFSSRHSRRSHVIEEDINPYDNPPPRSTRHSPTPKEIKRKPVDDEGFQFDLPNVKTLRRLSLRWDLWLYCVFFIIMLLIGLLLFINIYRSIFFKGLIYPAWAPTSWVLLLIWGVVFIFSLSSIWILSSSPRSGFYLLLILMNLVLLVISLILIWFTGVIILGTVVLGLAVLVAIFSCVMMSFVSILAMSFQIPYILFLILLVVISAQVSYDNNISQ